MKYKSRLLLIALIPIVTGIVVASILIVNSCRKDDMIPYISPVLISDVQETSFKGVTRVISDGGANVTDRGLCWGTGSNPTINDEHTRDGKGTGNFTSEATGLSPTTLYYVRPYATNREGTVYGEEVTVHTWSGTMMDCDNNDYHTIIIGSQEWMGENLRTKHLNDGTALGLIASSEGISIPGYAMSQAGEENNLPADERFIYGATYNGFALLTGKLCPEGWHMPSADEWFELVDYLGGQKVAGGRMKATGTDYWDAPNTGATNKSGFRAVAAGGIEYSTGGGGCGEIDTSGTASYIWMGMGYRALFWSTTQNLRDFTRADTVFYVAVLLYDSAGVYPGNGSAMNGRSVRCIKDK